MKLCSHFFPNHFEWINSALEVKPTVLCVMSLFGHTSDKGRVMRILAEKSYFLHMQNSLECNHLNADMNSYTSTHDLIVRTVPP